MLKSDRSFRGLVREMSRHFVILVKAEMLPSKGDPIKMDGDVYIRSVDVDYVQVLP